MAVVLITFLAFLIPVLIYLWIEWRKAKAKKAKDGITEPVRKKEPLNVPAFVKTVIVLGLMMAPILFISSLKYDFYPRASASLKIGFKHTGKRVADCDEAEMIRKEGERYRRSLKDTRQVAMDVAKLANCPRERHPVYLKVSMDGKVLVDKAYSPTGLKKDMASYIYEEFLIEPGVHKFSVSLYDHGDLTKPDHLLEETVEIKERDIKLLRFDEKDDRLLVE